jgi:hypothetical protein
MIGKDLFLDRQHPFIDQAVAVVVIAVANFGQGPAPAIADDALATFRTDVFPRDALAHTATGLAELRPIFVNLRVAVVVHPVARFGIWLRLPRRDRFHLSARSVNGAQGLGASHLAAATDGEQPHDSEDYRRA